MNPLERQKSLKLLTQYRDFPLCREIESAIHSKSQTTNDYLNNVLRVSWNIYKNPSIDSVSVVFEKDVNLIFGTIIEKIEKATKERNERFERMLQEKYDSINESGYNTLLKCRRCGSSEISYEEKQTRSADEAATIFVSCSTCKNRWIMS